MMRNVTSGQYAYEDQGIGACDCKEPKSSSDENVHLVAVSATNLPQVPDYTLFPADLI